ncbi:MAG: NAD(P)-dependent alcohol dehydrogenase [Treponema sp.]|nr:NAD(P)-dependent alcohol dehydrogenase [Treponema sp.]
MKGFAMLGIGKIGWIEKERPVCGPLDAICKPLTMGTCTSDVHTVWEGAIGDRRDLILGHEAIGEVVEVGSLVKDFKPGDKVIIPAITPDWNSLDAQRGYPMHSGGALGGWKFSNFKDGVFADFFHVNDADGNMALLPEGMDLAAATMLADMVPTGFHGVELADVQFGDIVVVIGVGPVGLMAVAGAALRGAAEILAVGSRPLCVQIAKEFGATRIVNYKEGDIVKQVLDLTKGKGADRVVIAGGDNNVLDQAIRMVKAGGRIGNVNYFGKGDVINIPRAEWGVGMGHKAIFGGLMLGGRLRMEKLAAMIHNKKIDPGKLVTHRFNGFENIEEALVIMRDKPQDIIKPVVFI